MLPSLSLNSYPAVQQLLRTHLMLLCVWVWFGLVFLKGDPSRMIVSPLHTVIISTDKDLCVPLSYHLK